MTFKQKWEKADGQHLLPAGVIEQMVQQAFPNKELTAQEIISGGCANLNIKIILDNKPFILRIYLRDPDAAYRERRLAVLLKEKIPQPETYYVGDCAGYRFAITEFLPGITLRDFLLKGMDQDIQPVLVEVGSMLAKITAYKFPKAGFFDHDLNVIKFTAEGDYVNFAKECLRDQIVVAQLGVDTVAKIWGHLEKHGSFFPDENQKSLVHGDFDPANILVDKVGGVWKITGILDWEFAFSGSVLCDVANMLRYAHQMPSIYEESFCYGLSTSGVALPENWRVAVHLLNLSSLLDCLVRADPQNRPNQCADIRELVEHIIGQLDQIKITKQIEVVPYDPHWPQMFTEEALQIKQALGDNCVDIHHVGSTSVPGLSAKPIIDIITVVNNAADSVNDLRALGYTYKGELNIPFRCYFSKTAPMKVNLHVYEVGNPEIELNLLFKDYLCTHPDALTQYAELKAQLLQQKSSFEKVNSLFTGYSLGKEAFIRKILEQTGFKKLRLMHCTHYQEWETYHRIREEQIFKPIHVAYDRNHPTIQAANHYHFVLYQGTQIVCVAHIEFLNDQEVALRSLATDESFKRQGYASSMLRLLEKWIKLQGRHVIKMHSRLSAEPFYRKLGYIDMAFDDPCIQPEYVDLGKVV